MLRPSPCTDGVVARLWVVDLRDFLGDYEVTAVPSPPPRLALVWSASDDLLPEPPGGVLAVLDDYRVTQVPKAS
jgi:hypothetical protein